MQPLISCVMPIADRHEFIPGVLACFFEQDWQNRELIVIDNGKRDCWHYFAGIPHVEYRRVSPGPKIGELRNLACEVARGEYIAHWDSDDWYGPKRLSEQALVLRQSRRPATGYNVLPFADDLKRRAWLYEGAVGYACGTSLFYMRSFWVGHKFSGAPIYGEDNEFIKRMEGRLISDSRGSIVARVHDRGTSPRDLYGWREIDYTGLAMFGYPIHEVVNEPVVSESGVKPANERNGSVSGAGGSGGSLGSATGINSENPLRTDHRPAYLASGGTPDYGADGAPRRRRKRRDESEGGYA